ncbi:UbiX family flavin prenyltransferase [Caloramator sp. E03]|uniref:UbiX family flavin prenyltransferase n=1 Tax=Caloramator sp. E03 TaxID=2576307 RepID=UPI0011108C78|nr:UbiX family flavin prenyltransferase [Caloramator sp. E03]QCX33176.1 UbiX family flavin prenyltransferase [Caloramator sp. E03]
MRIVVCITGATGAIYGIKFLEALKQYDNVTTHLIISEHGKENIKIETSYSLEYVYSLVNYAHENSNLAACVSSGSFEYDAVVIIPCSMKTLSSVANGYSENLISRVSDVALKERRKLIICPRESPLNSIHIELMLKLSNMGAYIIPPMPAFYNKPKTIDDIIDHHIMKLLDKIGIENRKSKRWEGMS